MSGHQRVGRQEKVLQTRIESYNSTA